ncbi:hypothetical protein P691DRAFT_778396 [Macrolepiota fuliginosa MF-IS2]|uniref:WW domain-containing protein n=1 Tax=Macrolepiota fuliginosa MF-IS2 TaxID=1400762 RepID=A0A9P5X6U1_9AGAR|nr:hypothetical protein P691DRAFT_778396 [Macrolepiota fuliginosa MF-IS2]
MTVSQKPSSPAGKLYPTFPEQDGSRYRCSKRSQPISIETSALSSPTYLPPQWSAHVQPEGKIYFYHDGLFKIVTESWIYESNVAEEVQSWIDHLVSEIQKKEIEPTDLELCIRVDDDKDCLYYIVRKSDQTIFWLEDYKIDEIGHDRVVSSTHLRTALEAQFWLHIDRFPAHFGGLPEKTLLKLVDVFTHARIDQITSLTAAFTYSPVDTEALHNLLKGCRGRTQEPEVVSTVARAWHLVLYNRFWNQYGEETPRLSSTMSVLHYDDEVDEREGYSKSVMSFATFRKSERYRTKLNSLYVDRYIYSHRVHELIGDLLKEWREQRILAFMMLWRVVSALHFMACYNLKCHYHSLHSIFFLFPASHTGVAFSAACFSASLLTSSALIQYHDGMLEHRNSPEAISWLSRRSLEGHKFQRLAFALALPTALANWGLVVFFGCLLCIGLAHLSIKVAAIFIVILGLACFAFVSAIAPESIPTFKWRRFLRKNSCDEKESPV